MVCEYPFILDDKVNQRNFFTAEGYNSDGGFPSGMTLPRIVTSQDKRSTNKSFNSVSGAADRLNTRQGVIKQAENLDENRIVLYKRGK